MKKFYQKYEVLMSALEGGVLFYSSVKSFEELCEILEVSPTEMEKLIYTEVGLSSEELIKLYKQ